ncbi:MAG: UDP-N-acetylglucosamine 2-epimerase (non-hydrolyzing) [Candidatus Brocadiia bacterium]
MRILNVVGARPNFIKIAPFLHAAKKYRSLDMVLVHTGQHYDYNMSQVFFNDLCLPKPDIHLGIGSGSHAGQTGRIMMALDKAIERIKPSLVVVVGDVNSTLAGALVAAKLHIPIAHIEAGVRSFDKRMPEEVNRVVTDSVSDYLFAPSDTARRNLINEDASPANIFVVGNIMIDALKFYYRPTDFTGRHKLAPKGYAMVTLHRPANVDDKSVLSGIIKALIAISRDVPVFFPVHPRTRKQLDKFNLLKDIKRAGNIITSEPLGYIDSLNAIKNARLVLTDSGGVQEEAVAFRVPCLTLRQTTEWVETIGKGNSLAGNKPGLIIKLAQGILRKGVKVSSGASIPLWDGRASERMMGVISRRLSRS